MPDIIERLSTCIENGVSTQTLLADALAEITEQRKRQNELEKVLIILVRTGWPWGEDGEPNELFLNCKDGYAAAMIEARELLGFGLRSTITRTEPAT